MNPTHRQISFHNPPPSWLCILMACLCLCACSRPGALPASASSQPLLTMMPTSENAEDRSFLAIRLSEYQKKNGVRVNTLSADDSVDTRLRLLQSIFARKASEPDICEIDNIWPGMLADDLIDLRPYLGDELTAIDQRLLQAFTVSGRLVAIPESIDTALLFYRTDLLKKYGYSHPPRTWDELGVMAKVIQDGERKAGEKDFWGYVWQGSEGEGLTCNAMEWQRAEGADLIDDSGALCPLNQAAELALKRARCWVGTISPPSVVEYDEEDALNLWLGGSAAFARGWLAFYGPSKASPLLANRFAAIHLPGGGKGYAWTFGGMGLAVSRYSANPQAAVDVIRYLTSSVVQRQRALAVFTIPSRSSLASDTSLLGDTAFNGWLSEHWQEGMFARPSAQTGKRYAAISQAYSKAVHEIISGSRDTHDELTRLHTELAALLQSPNAK